MIKFSVSGLRGVVGADLTSLDFAEVSNAYTRFMKAKTMLVARDARISGLMLAGAVKAAALAAGAEVKDAGLATTPTAVYATKVLRTDAGIVVTASHNPADQNGLKFLETGRFLAPGRVNDLIEFLTEAKFEQASGTEIQSCNSFNAVDAHLEGLLKYIPNQITKPRLKVGLDPVNGAAGPEAVRILEKLNCEVHAVNLEPTGRFGRGTEPVPENLTGLATLVRDKGLDMGFAFDPDGDRLAFVDERGRIPGEEYTVPLCARWVLEKKGGDVVVNISTSRLIDYVAAKKGSAVNRTPVGEAHVVDKMSEINASCGGEGNGGFILPAFNATRDGLLAMALLLTLHRSTDSLANLVDELPTYQRLKEKFEIKWSEDLTDKISSLYPHSTSDKQDGLRLETEDFWLHLRPSNTEPVVRLIIEASTQERAQKTLEEVKKICAG